jgi:hypothetical protein
MFWQQFGILLMPVDDVVIPAAEISIDGLKAAGSLTADLLLLLLAYR